MKNLLLEKFREIGAHQGNSKLNRNPLWTMLTYKQRKRWSEIDPKTAKIGTIFQFLYEIEKVKTIIFEDKDIIQYIERRGLTVSKTVNCQGCDEILISEEGKLALIPENSFQVHENHCPICNYELDKL